MRASYLHVCARILLVLCMYVHVFACIRDPQRPQVLSPLYCMYCMYWYVLLCIAYVFSCIVLVYTISLQTNTNIQTNANIIQTQKICMYYVRWMYVFVMYLCVLVCIDFDDMNYFLESISILTDIHMSMDANSICRHHRNSVLYFLSRLVQKGAMFIIRFSSLHWDVLICIDMYWHVFNLYMHVLCM